jgi:hypothetical protein
MVSPIKSVIDTITSAIPISLDPVAFLVQMPFDTVAFSIESFSQFVLAIRSGSCRSSVEPVVDSIASGIEMLIDTCSSRIQTLVDPIAAPSMGAIISRSRHGAAKNEKAYSDHN